LDLGSLSMQVIEPKLVAAHTDVVDATSKRLHSVLNFVSGGNLALCAILFNVRRERPGDMELVWVGVRVLGLLELLNLAATEFVVLLLKAKLVSFEGDNVRRTFGLRSSSLRPAAAAAPAAGAGAFSALLAFAASFARCFSLRLSSLSDDR